MREFTNPYYDGPECPCCTHIADAEFKRIVKMLQEIDSPCADWVVYLMKDEKQ